MSHFATFHTLKATQYNSSVACNFEDPNFDGIEYTLVIPFAYTPAPSQVRGSHGEPLEPQEASEITVRDGLALYYTNENGVTVHDPVTDDVIAACLAHHECNDLEELVAENIANNDEYDYYECDNDEYLY